MTTRDKIKELQSLLIKDSDGFMRLGVGSQLARRIVEEFQDTLTAKLLFPNDDPDCGCSALARRMDDWGTDGCATNREEIIKTLTENAIKASIAGVGKMIVGPIRSKANEWLDESIRRVKHNSTILKKMLDTTLEAEAKR